MAENWDEFKLFDDSAVLDKSIFASTPYDATNNNSGYTADRSRFWAWMSRLRDLKNQPKHCGIPAERVLDVINLFKTFFPDINPNYAPDDPLPVFVSALPPIPPAVTYTPQAVPVTFGAATLDICDGPSALGYIFSIANPPAAPTADPASETNAPSPPPRTFENYAQALLALYSRCLYLCYIGSPELEATGPLNVPIASSIQDVSLQIPASSNSLPLLLGASLATGSPANAKLQGISKGRREMLEIWRRKSIIDPALAIYTPPRTLPNLPPVLAEKAATAFFRIFNGLSVASEMLILYTPPIYGKPPPPPAKFTPVISPALADSLIWQPALLAFQAQWKSINPSQQLEPLPKAEVVDCDAKALSVPSAVPASSTPALPTPPTLASQLQSSLESIIALRWSPTYSRTDTKVQASILAFWTLYLIPHMFLQTISPDTGKPVPDLTKPEINPPTFIAIAAGLVTPLWAAYGNATLDVLDLVFYWVSTRQDALKWGGTATPIYGKCAECRPAAGLMPKNIPERVLPPANDNPQKPNPPGAAASKVQSLVLNVRVFNNHPSVAALAKSFDKKTLNALHNSRGGKDGCLYRTHCENCVNLLKALDVPIDEGLGGVVPGVV